MSVGPVIFLICFCQAFLVAIHSLNARAWQSLGDHTESDDFPELPYLVSRSNIAIGFSGGGSRAYVAALGQTSALHALGLLGKIKYMGGISGGAWATIVVTYAQNVTDAKKFLGEIIQPEDISMSILERIDQTCARRLANSDLAAIVLGLLREHSAISVADAWAAAIQIMYLDPVGVPKGERFSWNEETVEDIRRRNPDLKYSRFVLPGNPSWPFPIIGTTLVGPLLNAPYGEKNHNYTRIDITPLYVGQLKTSIVVYKYLFNLFKRTIQIGGAIESFAFARTGRSPFLGLPPDMRTAIIPGIPDPDTVFDLMYAVGASSYAPGAFVESIPLGISDSCGLHVNYWSPTESLKPLNYDMLFGDGGSIENLPLISFLQRKVKKMILFLNCDVPLQPTELWNVSSDSRKYGQVGDALPAYFGVFIEKDSTVLDRSYDYGKNAVFPEKDYVPLIIALQKAQKEGNGIIATVDLTTIENEYWGISKGFTSQITFIYLGRLSNWESKLNLEMKRMIIPPWGSNLADDIKTGPFLGFPHYTTLAGGINTERANLLANMVGWSILENSKLFNDLFIE